MFQALLGLLTYHGNTTKGSAQIPHKVRHGWGSHSKEQVSLMCCPCNKSWCVMQAPPCRGAANHPSSTELSCTHCFCATQPQLLKVQHFLWQCQSRQPISRAEVGMDRKARAETLLKQCSMWCCHVQQGVLRMLPWGELTLNWPWRQQHCSSRGRSTGVNLELCAGSL